MESLGIIRRIDELGRISIPKEVRRRLDIFDGCPMEIFVEDDCMILMKYDVLEDSRNIIKKAIDFVSEDLNLSEDKKSVVVQKLVAAWEELESK